jgi:methylated-DNA-[protein]-cysteine S-methyltransferase
LCSDQGFLTEIHFTGSAERSDEPLLLEAEHQLDQYFAGKLKQFSLPLFPHGTDFQMAVWQELFHIPFGQVMSYKEVAAEIGCPKAIRAVGQANRRNPLPILIPCHRVIAADGSLGGYAGGLPRKRFLLRLEGITPQKGGGSRGK